MRKSLTSFLGIGGLLAIGIGLWTGGYMNLSAHNALQMIFWGKIVTAVSVTGLIGTALWSIFGKKENDNTSQNVSNSSGVVQAHAHTMINPIFNVETKSGLSKREILQHENTLHALDQIRRQKLDDDNEPLICYKKFLQKKLLTYNQNAEVISGFSASDEDLKSILSIITKWREDVYMGIKNAEGEKTANEFKLVGSSSLSDPYRDHTVRRDKNVILAHLGRYRQIIIEKIQTVGTENLLKEFKCAYLKEYEG